MAMPGEPVVLPFKAERLSFEVTHGAGPQGDLGLELAVVCFDRDGNLFDAAHADRREALHGALRLAAPSPAPRYPSGSASSAAAPAGAAAVVRPFDFAPQVEVMLLVASVPASPTARRDLGCAKGLRFAALAREKGSHDDAKVVEVDLTPFVGLPAAGAGPLSNGHQSMIIGAVYSTPSGWTLSCDCSTYAADNWGALLPAAGRLLAARWPALSASEALAARGAAAGGGEGAAAAVAPIVVSRRGTDKELAALLQEAAGPAAGGDVAPAAAPEPPSKLQLEFGWALHPPKKLPAGEEGGEEELAEGEEDPEMEFTLTAYDIKGEELQSVSLESPEGEGMAVAEPEEAAAGDGEGGEEGEQGVEGGGEAEDGGDEEEGEGDEEVVEGEEELGEDERAERAAARREARAEARAAAREAKKREAEEERRAAALRKPHYPEAFPLKHKVTLALPELPKATRSLLLVVSNFGGGGMKRVASLEARLVAPAAGAGGGKGSDSVLLHCRYVSGEGADAATTQVALLKLYRELPDSAFSVWGAAGVASAGELAEGPAARDVLCSVLEARMQLVAEVAAAKAKAQEAGTDEDEELDAADEEDESIAAESAAAPAGVAARGARVQRARLLRGAWRARVVLAAAGGEEAHAAMVANALSYEGTIAADGVRCDAAAKALFPNGDSYFGGYSDDAKEGPGLYVFASGAAYLGSYRDGKRAGRGLMVVPDGGWYQGEWAGDRFEGQGEYHYPDGSYYSGSWKAGRKEGYGAYWDAAGGVLRGQWAGGALAGAGSYDQPHYHFEGAFVGSVPAGPCKFELAAFRNADLPAAATSYIAAELGPTLRGEGAYAIPAGAAAAPGGEGEGGDGGDKPPLPAFPKYEGLTYVAGGGLPANVPDVPFPPALAAC